MKVSYENIEKLLDKVNDYSMEVDSYEFGIPMSDEHVVNLVDIIVSHLGLQLNEDARIYKIIKATGCDRETAINLLKDLEEQQ